MQAGLARTLTACRGPQQVTETGWVSSSVERRDGTQEFLGPLPALTPMKIWAAAPPYREEPGLFHSLLDPRSSDWPDTQ